MVNDCRLIDADTRIEEIKKANCTNCDNYNGIKCRACWVDDAIGLIDDAPTVDAVEVVRCEKCQYWNKRYETKGICLKHNCIVTFTSPDFYCACGERKSDGICKKG